MSITFPSVSHLNLSFQLAGIDYGLSRKSVLTVVRTYKPEPFTGNRSLLALCNNRFAQFCLPSQRMGGALRLINFPTGVFGVPDSFFIKPK